DTNSSIISCIRQVHSLLIEIYIVYVVYFISIFIIFIYHLLNQNNNKSNDYYIVKNNNGDWIYKCNLEEMNFFINCFHLIVMILLLINGRKLLKYQGVFKCTKYIIYSLYIGIAFGPIVNITSFLFLNNQRYARIVFEFLLNSICNIILLLLVSWNKVYFILKKEGNNPNKYFIYITYEKCLIHNSESCECDKMIKNEDNSLIIIKYINFYKFCTTIIKFD
ncbi:hypothetical protein U3516DRAFT_494694, partial [Neocallimastix sp. 'constans']